MAVRKWVGRWGFVNTDVSEVDNLCVSEGREWDESM
jgi:hypothetical protein